MTPVRGKEVLVPRKLTTWIGFVVILAAGVFSFLSLYQSRSKFVPGGTRYHIATIGAFAALVVMALAMFLWYYFSEKASPSQPPHSPEPPQPPQGPQPPNNAASGTNSGERRNSDNSSGG